jgi:hypothetical protein
MTRDTLDRVIVARLIEAPPEPYPLAPFPYLLTCCGRATDAVRARPGGSVEEKAALHDLAVEARAQVVQYASLLLSGSGVVPEVRRRACGGCGRAVGARVRGWPGFPCVGCGGASPRHPSPRHTHRRRPCHSAPSPQPAKAAARGGAQLADALIAAAGGRAELGVVAAPPGFLEELAAKAEDSLADILKPTGAGKGGWVRQHVGRGHRLGPAARSQRPPAAPGERRAQARARPRRAVAAGPNRCAVRDLASKVQAASPLGDYSPPLAAMRQLVSVEPIAKARAAVGMGGANAGAWPRPPAAGARPAFAAAWRHRAPPGPSSCLPPWSPPLPRRSWPCPRSCPTSRPTPAARCSCPAPPGWAPASAPACCRTPSSSRRPTWWPSASPTQRRAARCARGPAL